MNAPRMPPSTDTRPRAWRTVLVVAWKELVDSLRDRRTLLTTLLAGALIGPMMLYVLSMVIEVDEQRAAARELSAIGIGHAPTLAEHLARQGFVVQAPPADWEALLHRGRGNVSVLVIPEDFEERLARGVPPRVALWSASGEFGSSSAARRWSAALQGFEQEQVSQRLVQRGVAPAALTVLAVDTHDVTPARQRGAGMLRMIPIFVLMSVLYGAMHITIDITAGERERGSLEPLLMTPAPLGALVGGKWLAASLLSMASVVMTCLGFLPGRWLLGSELLAANFHFGAWEALKFIALLLPFAALMAAVLMDVAVRSRSVREAQASTSVIVMMVAMAPMMLMVQGGGTPEWLAHVPVLGQIVLMQRVLGGEALGATALVVPALFAFFGVALALADLHRALRRAVQA